jgi:hypothetical protein
LPDDVQAQVRERLESASALSGVEGLGDIPAEDLSKLVGLHSIMSDEETFADWWNTVGEELDLFDGEEPGAAATAAGATVPPLLRSR